MYLIKRIDGAYVAKPGSAHSYVFALVNARKFSTKEEAERDLCPENERVVDLERELDDLRR